LTPTPLTPPEDRTQRDQGRRVVDRIKANPCAYCLNRVTGWGLTACGIAKKYPACLDGAPGFDPDHAAIAEKVR